MSNEINKKIAEWLGWETFYMCGALCHGYQHDPQNVPDFQDSDAAAILLLQALETKGHYWELVSRYDGQKEFVIYNKTDDEWDTETVAEAIEPTISAAITSAILVLIDREG